MGATTDRRQLQTMAFFTNRELEGHRPLNIFLVNETDHTLEFCDPKCEWGQEGTPMVKHDRYMVEPNQSCVVFAKETSLPLLGTSPMGPKGKFGMRLADLQDEKFTIRYNHPPLGKTTVEVKCPPGFVYFVSNEAHLQHPDASTVLHLLRRPHTAELAKEEKLKGKMLERR